MYPVSACAFKQALSNVSPFEKTNKKTKNLNFRPREAQEFLGSWDKIHTVKTQKFHNSGVCLWEDKHSQTKIGP